MSHPLIAAIDIIEAWLSEFSEGNQESLDDAIEWIEDILTSRNEDAIIVMLAAMRDAFHARVLEEGKPPDENRATPNDKVPFGGCQCDACRHGLGPAAPAPESTYRVVGKNALHPQSGDIIECNNCGQRATQAFRFDCICDRCGLTMTEAQASSSE
jgi:hypothetical protein